jgi:biotin carboxyl carrier protein
MKRYRITLEDHTFDVQVLDDPRRERVRVEVDGQVFTVGVEAVPPVGEAAAEEGVPAPPQPLATPNLAPREATAPASALTAPLPGVVKSIAVRPGQRVARDDALLVIEAMKMDNVIRASHEGTIGTVYVAEGRQVAYGEPLLEMNNEQ